MKKEEVVIHAKSIGLKPLLEVEENQEVYGLNWSGFFVKGIVKKNYVHFEDGKGIGGVREIGKSKAIINWEGKIVFPLQTVGSELYFKPITL